MSCCCSILDINYLDLQHAPFSKRKRIPGQFASLSVYIIPPCSNISPTRQTSMLWFGWPAAGSYWWSHRSPSMGPLTKDAAWCCLIPNENGGFQWENHGSPSPPCPRGHCGSLCRWSDDVPPAPKNMALIEVENNMPNPDVWGSNRVHIERVIQ